MDERFRSQADIDLRDVLARALQSGNPDYYDVDDSSTHPFFDQDLELVPSVILEMMGRLFDKEIEELDLQARALRVMVPWNKRSWSYGEIFAYTNSQKAQIRYERLWHLREELNNLLKRRQIREACKANVLTVLSMGWGSQSPGEA